MSTTADNTKSLLKKKTIPRRNTIHTTSPSKESIENGSPITPDVPQTPSNSPDGSDTQQLLSQLEKAQSTTNDLINEVEQSKIENSSNNLHEESNEPDQDSSKEPDQDSSKEPDQDSSKEPDQDSSKEPDQDSSKEPDQHSSKMMSREELEAELDRIGSELKEEKKKNARKSYSKGELEIKVSKKGAIQINGLRKLPITIYKQEWQRLFPIIDKIKQFIEDHPDELTTI